MDVTLSQLKEIAGPRLIGFLMNSMLYGSLGVQVYFYYQAFPKDRPFIKYLVYGLFILETVQTAMTFRDCYIIYTHSLIDPAQVNSVALAWLDVAIIEGIIVAFIISAISFVQAISSFASGIVARTASLTALGRVSTRPTCIWLIGSAVCDILIASFMAYYLWRCDSKIRQTRALINKLIRMTIETGSLTASVATADVIMFMLDKPKYLAASMAFSLILSKLYSTTTLAILNNRRNLGYADEIVGPGQPLSAIDLRKLPGCHPNILSVFETDPMRWELE